PGEDVTLVTYGPLVTTALDVAAAAQDDGVSVEVVDLRVISPVDIDTVVTSVRKTGRLVIAHEAPTSFGVGAEIAARVRKKCFYDLEAPMIRVGGFHTPYPASRSEHHYLPDVDRILDGIDRALEYGGGEHEYSPVQAPRRRRGPHGSGHPDLESRCR
ncbi:transketolase C-terminal domain-containing protein, partial [Kocuria marina]